MDYSQVLRTLSHAFEDRGIAFAVIGGFALHAYGLSRTTFDLDFLIDGEAQEQVVALLEEIGYRTLYRSSGYSNHLHSDVDWGRVDAVYVRGDTSRDLFAGCRQYEILPGLPVPVPRPEHLAALKIHAMSNDPERTRQEMADLDFLLNLPETDREEVREQFEKRGLLEKYRELDETD